MAFFPCIHFTGVSQMWFSLSHRDYAKWDIKKIIDYMIVKNHNRADFFDLINKLVAVVLMKGLRMVIENPWMGQTHLRVWLKQPDLIDYNRMLRGDYMIKPTAYWFWNCEHTAGTSVQKDKGRLDLLKLPKSKQAGLCSEERSMISPDYARNFICDFLIGKQQTNTIPTLF